MKTPAHHFGLYRTARQCVLGDLGEVLVTHYPDEAQALAALASLGDGYEIRPVTRDGHPLPAPVSPLTRALFSAEAVAHLRGYEREILPLADLARGMDKRIAELEAALAALVERAEAVASGIPVHNRHEGVSQATHVAHMASHLAQHVKPAREVLARTVQPLAPENIPAPAKAHAPAAPVRRCLDSISKLHD